MILKFLIRNDNLSTTDFETLVKVKSEPSNIFATAKLLDPPGTVINSTNNFLVIPALAFNKLIAVTVPDGTTLLKIRVKVKDANGERDESNIVRFSVDVQPDENYIYCLSIEMINDGSKIISASELFDKERLGGKGNTIVIGAGMP